jgi:hypothetical protein
LPWEQDNDYIRSGHRNPDEFQKDTFRTVELSPTEGIKAVIAKPKGKHTMEVQSYLFDKNKNWTLDKAKTWFNEHQQKEKESHQWFGEIYKPQTEANNLIHGQALHPIRTLHPEEWPEVRQYLEEELLRATPTLIGKPLVLDHNRILQGKVVNAKYKDGAIEYLAKLDDNEILDKVAEGKIRHCSVEFEWGSLERVNGFSPRNITFTGLSLLENYEPGDPAATVEVWEAIISRLKESQKKLVTKEQANAEPNEFILYLIVDPAAFLEDRFSTVWTDQTNGIQGLYGHLREKPDSPKPMALLFMKAQGWTLEKIQDWLQTHQQYLKQTQTQLITEAILPPETPQQLYHSDFVNKQEILDLLPERIPLHWGYGPTELVRRLKNKLESQSQRSQRDRE